MPNFITSIFTNSTPGIDKAVDNGYVQNVDMDYGRFESNYIKNNITSRKADIIEFAFNGKTLLLNFNEKKREY